MIDVSFIVPAYNEATCIEHTLKALRQLPLQFEIIVVNDGSTDLTRQKAKKYADHMITLPVNQGKGFALQTGWRVANGNYIVTVDADLKESVSEAIHLLPPLKNGDADFTISIIDAGTNAGMGFVKKRTQSLIYRQTGVRVTAPLSGQRAFHRKWLPLLLNQTYYRFGIEAQMTIDLLRAGATCVEVQTLMTHREMGRGVRGFKHRLKQWIDIERQYWGVYS